MKSKKIYLSLLPTIAICPTVVACNNYSDKNDLLEIVPKKYDVVKNIVNNEEERTKKILNILLDQAFKDNSARKTEFLNTQQGEENDKRIIKKLREMFDEYYEQDTDNQKAIFIDKMGQFYSDNWYWVLTHLKDFEGRFYKWLLFPSSAEGHHSQAYIDSLEYETEPLEYKIPSNYLDDLKEGDESAELADTNIFYLTQGKWITRIKITGLLRNEQKVELEPIVWYFAKAKQKLSIHLISDIVHSAFVHGFSGGFERFEEDMANPERYGKPAEMVLFYTKGL